MKDVREQKWATEKLASKDEAERKFVKKIFDTLEIEDPSLILFWTLVGYTLAVLSKVNKVKGAWATQFFTLYCYFVVRKEVGGDLNKEMESYDKSQISSQTGTVEDAAIDTNNVKE